MKVIYKKTVYEEIEDIADSNKDNGKHIKEILLTASEANELYINLRDTVWRSKASFMTSTTSTTFTTFPCTLFGIVIKLENNI